MAELIVEDGTGKPDADSYISIADADAYFEGEGAPAAWCGVRASGRVRLAAQPSDAQTVTLDGKVYTFEAALTNVDGHVALGADVATTRANLAAALVLGAGAGSAYAAATSAHASLEGVGITGPFVDVRARVAGTWGNALALASTLASPNGVSGATLTGGADSTLDADAKRRALRAGARYVDLKYGPRFEGWKTHDDQALEQPKAGIELPEGAWDEDTLHPAVPLAAAEAGLVAATQPTLLLPTQAKPGGIQAETKELGPLKKSVTYAGSGTASLPKLTKVDALLAPLLCPGNRAYRGG